MKAPEIKRLKEIREQLGLTQEKFADELGIKQGSYSGIERGVVGISSDVLKALIQKYRINTHWLMTGEGTMYGKGEIQLSNKSQDNGQYGSEIVEILREQIKEKDYLIRVLLEKLGKDKVLSDRTASELLMEGSLTQQAAA